MVKFLLAKLRKLLTRNLPVVVLWNFPSSKKMINLYESPIIHIEAHRFFWKSSSQLFEKSIVENEWIQLLQEFYGPISYVFLCVFWFLDAYYTSHLVARTWMLYTTGIPTKTKLCKNSVTVSIQIASNQLCCRSSYFHLFISGFSHLPCEFEDSRVLYLLI